MFHEKLKFHYERLFSSINKFSTRPTDVSSSGKIFRVSSNFALSWHFFPLSKDPGPLIATVTRLMVSCGKVLIERWWKNAKV